MPTINPPVPVFVLADPTEGSRVTEIAPEVEGTMLPRLRCRLTVIDNPVIIVALTLTVWEAWPKVAPIPSRQSRAVIIKAFAVFMV